MFLKEGIKYFINASPASRGIGIYHIIKSYLTQILIVSPVLVYPSQFPKFSEAKPSTFSSMLPGIVYIPVL